MKSAQYKCWYEKNREAVRAKQRERDAVRLAERRTFLAEHPELIDDERRKYRQKYHRVRQNKMKRLMEELVAKLEDEEAKQLIQNMIDNDAYVAFTPSMFQRLAKSVSASDSEENESSDGADAEGREAKGEAKGQTSD